MELGSVVFRVQLIHQHIWVFMELGSVVRGLQLIHSYIVNQFSPLVENYMTAEVFQCRQNIMKLCV